MSETKSESSDKKSNSKLKLNQKIQITQRSIALGLVSLTLLIVYLAVDHSETTQELNKPAETKHFTVLPESSDKEAFVAQYERRLRMNLEALEATQKKVESLKEELDQKLKRMTDDYSNVEQRLTEFENRAQVTNIQLANATEDESPRSSWRNQLVGETTTENSRLVKFVLQKKNADESSSRQKQTVIPGPALREDAPLALNRANGTTVQQYIPAGSFVSGTLLTGVLALTGPNAPSTPTPVLLKIEKPAKLPNWWTSDIQGCFLTGGATGELSSERVLIRLDRLSCVVAKGKPLDIAVKGYVAGEDGKVGLRGRLVSRSGQAIANAISVGVISGLAKAISLSTQQVVVGGSGDVSTKIGNGWVAGAGEGVSDATTRIANYYLKLAEQIFPVLEVENGRSIDVIFSQGVLLKTEDVE